MLAPRRGTTSQTARAAFSSEEQEVEAGARNPYRAQVELMRLWSRANVKRGSPGWW